MIRRLKFLESVLYTRARVGPFDEALRGWLAAQLAEETSEYAEMSEFEVVGEAAAE